MSARVLPFKPVRCSCDTYSPLRCVCPPEVIARDISEALKAANGFFKRGAK